MLHGKKILLGITGSIAAYKAAFLVRLLVKNRADVRVIMTPVAREFITPLTLATLSGHPVEIELFNRDSGSWTNHVDLGLWADLFLLAPVTANTLSKMAMGVADNLLLTVYLSARCPVMVAPAMDLDMFSHPTTVRNIKTLKKFGVRVLDAPSGDLASGLTGKGRLLEPEEVVDKVVSFLNKFEKDQNLRGGKILITAGPTYEAIDPVRFIGNHSSGKMGVALAEALAEKGAEVNLVLGPGSKLPENQKVSVTHVNSADDMYKVCLELFPKMNGAIMAAAVSDFTPENPSKEKTKRGAEDWVLQLKPTRDIAAALGKIKTNHQWLVGFALETNDELENAVRKIQNKNLDFIVLNSLNDKGAGFGFDTNKITLIDKHGKSQAYPLKSKTEVAGDIVNKILTLHKKL